MARKVFESRQDGNLANRSFETERRNLEQFKECLSGNQNIMLSFATFIHGSEFNIISPLADFDLAIFLYGKYSNFSQRAQNFTPHNLFSEAWRLCHAIHYLHDELYLYSNVHVQCAHLDLKPDNILVDWLPKNDSGLPLVGNWKIADFGISDIASYLPNGQPARNSAGSKLPLGAIMRERSLRPIRRGEGPFQPPEMERQGVKEVSTTADMWSFGCILSMILAFALGGPEEVTRQHQYRTDGISDYFYTMDSRVAMIKPGFEEWLQEKIDSPDLQRDEAWIKECRNLILDMLKINETERLPAKDARDRIQSVTKAMHDYRRGTKRMWIPEHASVGFSNSVSPGIDTGLQFSPASRRESWLSTNRIADASTRPEQRALSACDSVRLETPPRANHSVLSPCGRRAATWCKSAIYIYDLGFLRDPTLWNTTRQYSRAVVPKSSIYYESPLGHNWLFLQLAGPYIARVSSAGSSPTSTVWLPTNNVSKKRLDG
jgi:serine/threonine protein kinase